MKFEKKYLYIVGTIVSISSIWALFFKTSTPEIHQTYDTIENSEANGSNESDEKLIPGSIEEKVAITRQIVGGYEGFDLIAEELGWQTNSKIKTDGSINAIKGDTLRMIGADVYPPNFRSIGKDSRSQLNGQFEYMIYETLIGSDSETMLIEPNLATHWKMEKDSLTYKFRINPNARFSDDSEVTAEDFVATFKLLIDEGHGDPNVSMFWDEKFNIPTAESKYIVSIKAKKKEWRLIYSLTGIYVMPKKYLDKTNGKDFITKYQHDFMPGSGPYTLDRDRTTHENGGLVVLNRRDDYWAKNEPRNLGLWNFDVVEFLFEGDDNQLQTKFFKGEYDTYAVSRAQWWSEKFVGGNYAEINDGLVLRQKFINFQPMGLGGITFNILEEPFNDVKVRKAFCHLWDVKSLQEKLFFNEYVRKNSYFANSIYENPDNPQQDYNPQLAIKLLNEAGWARKDGDKWMTNSKGEIFELEMKINTGWDRIFNRFVSDLKDVGIKLEIVVVQNPFEFTMERKFKIHYGGWVGSLLPSPKGMMHSKYSEELESSNYTGIANSEIDKLIENYDLEWDVQKRIKLLQELDAVATKEYYWAFGWDAPYGYRSLNWNKFGMPEHGIGYSGGWLEPIKYWWIDPIKKTELAKAQSSGSKLPITSETIDYWNIISK